MYTLPFLCFPVNTNTFFTSYNVHLCSQTHFHIPHSTAPHPSCRSTFSQYTIPSSNTSLSTTRTLTVPEHIQYKKKHTHTCMHLYIYMYLTVTLPCKGFHISTHTCVYTVGISMPLDLFLLPVVLSQILTIPYTSQNIYKIPYPNTHAHYLFLQLQLLFAHSLYILSFMSPISS